MVNMILTFITNLSLGILEKIGYVTTLNNKAKKEEEIRIHGANWGDEIPVPEDRNYLNILVIHAPIAINPLFPDHQYTSAQRFFEKHGYYDLIVCGDIHRQFHIEENNRHLVNTGPMLRMTAEEYNFIHKPSFAVYDTDTKEIKWHIIPHKKATEILTRRHIEHKEQNTEMLEEFVQNLKETNVKGVNLKQNIMEYLKENPQSKSVTDILSEVMEDGE